MLQIIFHTKNPGKKGKVGRQASKYSCDIKMTTGNCNCRALCPFFPKISFMYRLWLELKIQQTKIAL